MVTVGSVMAIPEGSQAVATKANQWKESVDKKIKKEKKEKFEVLTRNFSFSVHGNQNDDNFVFEGL